MNPTDKPYFAHPTSCVDEPVSIGPGTKVWHFCHIASGAIVGRDCSIGQNCFVAGSVRIGDGCKIQNNVSIYDGVELEEGVFCGPSMVFTNVMNPRSEVSRKAEYRRTLVQQGATIGANATIVCGVTLGRYCFIAAGAVVTRDVPDFALIAGVPGRFKGWISRHGEQLTPDASGVAVCPATGERYRLTSPNVLIQA